MLKTKLILKYLMVMVTGISAHHLKTGCLKYNIIFYTTH